MQFLVFLWRHFPNLLVSSPQAQTLGDERRVAHLGFRCGFYYKLPHVNEKKTTNNLGGMISDSFEQVTIQLL